MKNGEIKAKLILFIVYCDNALLNNIRGVMLEKFYGAAFFYKLIYTHDKYMENKIVVFFFSSNLTTSRISYTIEYDTILNAGRAVTFSACMKFNLSPSKSESSNCLEFSTKIQSQFSYFSSIKYLCTLCEPYLSFVHTLFIFFHIISQILNTLCIQSVFTMSSYFSLCLYFVHTMHVYCIYSVYTLFTQQQFAYIYIYIFILQCIFTVHSFYRCCVYLVQICINILYT